MKLTYVADPMCSWCYGFAEPMQALLDQGVDGEAIELSLLMGGLRPYTREALSAQRAEEILEHWHHVHDASGQPFAQAPHTALQLAGFVYDTEPASRATIAVHRQSPVLAWRYFKSVQQAFYADARDVTRAEVLADLAEALQLPRAAFLREFESDALREATRQDFEQSQAWGIRGFPALVAEHNGELHLLANGYMPIEALRQRLSALRARQPTH
jgi:putative protein-disulfide isomerase